MSDTSAQDLCLYAIAAGMEKKAFRPVVMDLKNQGAFTQYFAILSATNPRQVSAVADGIKVFLREEFDIKPVAVDGLEQSTWVLMDYGAFCVHIFQEPTREIYQLERLWSKGRLVPIDSSIIDNLMTKTSGYQKPNSLEPASV